jgi:hypothetical protein
VKCRSYRHMPTKRKHRTCEARVLLTKDELAALDSLAAALGTDRSTAVRLALAEKFGAFPHPPSEASRR